MCDGNARTGSGTLMHTHAHTNAPIRTVTKIRIRTDARTHEKLCASVALHFRVHARAARFGDKTPPLVEFQGKREAGHYGDTPKTKGRVGPQSRQPDHQSVYLLASVGYKAGHTPTFKLKGTYPSLYRVCTAQRNSLFGECVCILSYQW